MDSLKELGYTLALISVLAAVIDVLNNSERISKYTKYITSLVVILIIITPLKNFLADFSSSIQQSEHPKITTQESNYQIRESLSSAIEYDLSNKLYIPNDVFSTNITLTSNESDILIDTIEIAITDQKYNRYIERIEYYLKNNYGCKIKVIPSIEE